MFDLLYYFMAIMFIIYILKNVKKHNKIVLKNTIKPNITKPFYKNEILYEICINEKECPTNSYYIHHHINIIR